MYARHLLEKLQDWVDNENPLAEEQAGFREGRSTIDQCLVLQHLIGKYSSAKTSSLYVAFIDLKAAFDSIPRNKLWEKLEDANIDRRLLLLIRTLYKDTSLRIRCTPRGQLSNAIPTSKGVKQGCILAPLLFNLYINSMASQLATINCHPPKIAGRHINALLYADDAAILSRTPVGLRRAIRSLSAYCKKEGLTINYNKTKIMAFARRPKPRVWKIDGHKIEQVSRFIYLGVVFHSNGTRKAHGEYVATNAQKSALAILRFFRSRGGSFIPAALKLFNAKSISQLLYGAQLGPFPNIIRLERVQSKFLRALLGVPKCVSNAFLRLETGQIRVEAKIWITIFNYWLKLHFCPLGLVGLINLDNFKSKWAKAVEMKMTSLGFSPELLINMGLDQARSTLSQRIYDSERQFDLAKVPSFPSGEESRYIARPAPYLNNIEVPSHRRAFTLARCHCLPSAVLDGRLKKIPLEKRLCPCGAETVESTEHILLYCPFYSDLRDSFILPLTKIPPMASNRWVADLLLSDNNPGVTPIVAQFCSRAIAIRREIMSNGPI